MIKSDFYIVGGVLLFFGVAGAGFWWYMEPPGTIPQPIISDATTTPELSSGNQNTTGTTSSSIPVSPAQNIFTLVPIVSGDTIVNWDFDGYLNDNGPREAEAYSKIEAWKKRLGGEEDYLLYISIAQEYDHLGDGKHAYEYLSRAIRFDSKETAGTAWHNLGILMEKLGAYHTARAAFDRTIKIQSNISSFHLSRIEFMIHHFADDTKGVIQAFSDAEMLLGTSSPILLDLRARWETTLP